MSIQKKSLIGNLTAAKKAIVAALASATDEPKAFASQPLATKQLGGKQLGGKQLGGKQLGGKNFGF